MGRLAGIAHEINNPINAVVNSLDPLAATLDELDVVEGKDPEARDDAQEILRVIRRGAQRTQGIVKALHNYSRTDEAGFRPVDIGLSVKDSVDLLRHQLREIDVELNIAKGLTMDGLAGQIDQVLVNLLANAAQAMDVSSGGGATGGHFGWVFPQGWSFPRQRRGPKS